MTTNVAVTLDYYKQKLDTECLGVGQDPPIYAIFARDGHEIPFHWAAPPPPNPVEFTRELANTPWNCREFVIKDCDGRLLAFGAIV